MGALRCSFLILSGFVIIGILYFGLRAWSVWETGYSWKEMDWDGNGSTSILELFESSDIGRRQVTSNGVKCTEYYSFKDGLRIKLSCETEK